MSLRFELIQIALSGVLAIWSAALFFILIIKIYIGSDKVKKAILIPALLALLCSFLVSIIDTIGYAYNWDMERYSSLFLLMIAKVSFWTIQFIARYIFLASLLYYAFQGSAYQISIRFLICHSIVILKVFLVGLAVGIFLSSQTDPSIVLLTSIVTAVNTLLYICGLCHLTWTINKKLFKLILLSADDNKNSIQHELSGSKQAQLSLLRTSTKLSVLQVIYTVSTVSYVIIAVLCNIKSDSKINQFVDFVAYWCSGIIRSLVLFLMFQCNDKSYSFLCKWCDQKCLSVYQYCADLKTAKKPMELSKKARLETVLSQSAISNDTKFTRTTSSRVSVQPSINLQSTVTVTMEQSDVVSRNIDRQSHINLNIPSLSKRDSTPSTFDGTCTTLPNQSSVFVLPHSAMATPITDVDEDGVEESHSPLCLENNYSTQL